MKQEYNAIVLNSKKVVKEINCRQVELYKTFLIDQIKSKDKIEKTSQRDQRTEEALDIFLPNAFNFRCGVRGSYLSGG